MKTFLFLIALMLGATVVADELPRVSSISIGHPSVAIIEGQICLEGESFTTGGQTYTLKKISDSGVIAINKAGEEFTLPSGLAKISKPAKPITKPGQRAAIKEELAAQKAPKKAWTRDELKNLLPHGTKKDQVLQLLGKPDTTQEGLKGRDEWYYHDVSVDPVSGNVDRGLRVYFGIGYDDRPVVASSSARVGGGGNVYSPGGDGKYGKDDLQSIVFVP